MNGTLVRLSLFISITFSCALALAEPACVSQSSANLRTGPGKKFAVAKSVPRNTPLMKLETKNSWVEVRDFEGGRHWVSSSAISSDFSCVVVKFKNATLREGPGKDFPPVESAQVERSSSFKKTGRDGEWIQVQTSQNGRHAPSWIHETNVWIPMSKSRIAF